MINLTAQRLLRGQNLHFFDLRRLGEEFVGAGKERFRNLTIEMRLTAVFARKRIKDAERRFVNLKRVPGDGFLFGLCCRKRAL
ncbi:MAG: hypothetical protein R6U20_02860 [Longimonas sp.]